jgi:ABC-2 type transport system ATP-binding protein
MAATAAVVECHGIEKRYGRRVALTGVGLRLEAGRFQALIGPNGAGKSTLIKVLMRMVLPSAGTGHVLGVPLAVDSGRMNHQIGYVSEDLRFRLPMSIGAFAAMLGQALPTWDARELRRLMDAFALDPALRLTALSRGQRMRYFFALAMARRPRLVLIDEIGAVLDAGARAYVHEVLAAACGSGTAVLMATNVPTEVQSAVDRVAVLDAGGLRVETSLAEFAAAHVKLRLPRGVGAPAGSSLPAAVTLAGAAAGEAIVLIPASGAQAWIQAGALPDRRQMTTEEMVTFYMSTARAIAASTPVEVTV